MRHPGEPHFSWGLWWSPIIAVTLSCPSRRGQCWTSSAHTKQTQLSCRQYCCWSSTYCQTLLLTQLLSTFLWSLYVDKFYPTLIHLLNNSLVTKELPNVLINIQAGHVEQDSGIDTALLTNLHIELESCEPILLMLLLLVLKNLCLLDFRGQSFSSSSRFSGLARKQRSALPVVPAVL